MPSTHIMLNEETKMFGAAQIMVGLIHCFLGYFWLYLYVQQHDVFSLVYLPITLVSGYPFLGFVVYITSGTLAVQAEKNPSTALLTCAATMNVSSFTIAMIGLFLVVLEVAFFLAHNKNIQWPHQSGMILSAYVWIFSIIEMFLAQKITRWVKQALRQESRHT